MYADRPRFVTFTALGVLAIGLFHFWQVLAIGSRTDIALAYGGTQNFITIQQIAGFLWGSFWVWMAWTIVRSRSLNLLRFATALLIYTIFWWLLAQISPSNLDQSRRLFWVIFATAMFLAAVPLRAVETGRSDYEPESDRKI